MRLRTQLYAMDPAQFGAPYGMALLATMHWVATTETLGAWDDLELTIAELQDWSERKRWLAENGRFYALEFKQGRG